MHVCMHVYACVYVCCVCMCAYVCMYMYIYVCACMCACIHICVCVLCICVHTCVCVHVCEREREHVCVFLASPLIYPLVGNHYPFPSLTPQSPVGIYELGLASILLPLDGIVQHGGDAYS